jgi:DNA polymerase epsilon subunit 1
VTAAKRLSEFLGTSSIKGKGICCYYIISERPIGRPVTDRAVPTTIF